MYRERENISEEHWARKVEDILRRHLDLEEYLGDDIDFGAAEGAVPREVSDDGH